MRYCDLSRFVDITLCLDVTDGMEGALKRVRANIGSLYEDIRRGLRAEDGDLDSLRVRLLAFGASGVTRATEFFALPREAAALSTALEELKTGGRGAGDGLEALALAIRSDWAQEGEIRRHIIMVLTDEGALPLEGKGGQSAPALPRSLKELREMWEDPRIIDDYARWLLLFAPNKPDWNKIARGWKDCVHHPCRAGRGLAEIDHETIVGSLLCAIR